MDETEFRQILEVFPVVRSRDYHADSDSSNQVTRSAPTEEVKEWQDARNDEDERGLEIIGDTEQAFWGKLKSAAEEKMWKLVYEELSLDAARNIINSWT
ncbi:hypothetical protein OROHE_017452 [Orobanche hederae]